MTTDPYEERDAVDGPNEETATVDPAHYDRGISRDTLYELLSDTRQRVVLACLRDRSGPLDLDELATRVAIVEGADRNDLRVALHHITLPKLDDLGAVEYDPIGTQVSATDRIDALDPYLP